MEISFKEPTLEVYNLLGGYKKSANTNELLNYIKEKRMIGLYDKLCKNEVLIFDESIYNKIKEDTINMKESFFPVRADHDNESEVLQQDIKYAEFYSSILDYENFNKLVPSIITRNPSSSLKMDIILCKIRMNIILNDRLNLFKVIEEGKDIVERGCDWDRRNKFKSYQGLYLIINSNFTEASDLFYSSLPAFESKELMKYNDMVILYIFSGLLTFKRNEIKEKILDNGNVNETRIENEVALELVESFYNCDYDNIFVRLHDFLNQKVTNNIFLMNNVNSFIKLFVSRIFGQLLESYKSLSLESMASIFGIGEEYLEGYLSEFIVDRRLDCMIDRVNRLVFVIEKNVSEEMLIGEKANVLMTHLKKNIK